MLPSQLKLIPRHGDAATGWGWKRHTWPRKRFRIQKVRSSHPWYHTKALRSELKYIQPDPELVPGRTSVDGPLWVHLQALGSSEITRIFWLNHVCSCWKIPWGVSAISSTQVRLRCSLHTPTSQPRLFQAQADGLYRQYNYLLSFTSESHQTNCHVRVWVHLCR